MTTPQNMEKEKLVKQHRVCLEEVLDKYFPKVEEESTEKHLMKRGEALVLFGEALQCIRETYDAAHSLGENAMLEKWKESVKTLHISNVSPHVPDEVASFAEDIIEQVKHKQLEILSALTPTT